MAPSASLPEAAARSFDNLQVHWRADTLRSALMSFWTTSIDEFPDSEVKGHPTANWLTVIAALTSQMPLTDVPITQLTIAANEVYRLCWMTQALFDRAQISLDQANFLLARYNQFIQV